LRKEIKGTQVTEDVDQISSQTGLIKYAPTNKKSLYCIFIAATTGIREADLVLGSTDQYPAVQLFRYSERDVIER